MPYSTIAIANLIIEKSHEREIDDLSPIKLIKLVYLAHAASLAIIDQPLINESIQAWKYGPVILSISNEFKAYGRSHITSLGTEHVFDDTGFQEQIITPTIKKSNHTVNDIIDFVLNLFGDQTDLELSRLTHDKISAWHETNELHNIEDTTIYRIDNSSIKLAMKKRLKL